jgi:phytol kinase
MDPRDALALVLSVSYFAALLVALEVGRRWLGLPPDFARRALFLGLSVWPIAATELFTSWKWSVLPPLGLAAVDYLSYRYELLPALERSGEATLGTVWLPLSMAILLASFWRPGFLPEGAHVVAAALIASTWGDALAWFSGQRYGTRRYRFWGHDRTMEGSLAFFFSATVASTLVLFGLAGMDLHQSLAFAMITATVGSGVEAVSAQGTDNLTVPLATGGTLELLGRLAAVT